MIDDEKVRGKIGIGLGLLIQFLGSAQTQFGGPLAPYAVTMAVAGTVLLVWGCAAYAKSKGYAPLLGGVLGLTSFIGPLLLALLPTRRG